MRSILISYAGYPFTPSSLMPDNGLANLAGALIEAGHETLILDYGTVDMIKRLYPEHIAQKTKPIYRKIFGTDGKSAKPSLVDLVVLKYFTYKLEKHQERVIDDIAAEVIAKIKEFKPDFIGFKLWNGDGFTGSIRIAETIKKEFPALKIFGGGPQVDIFKGHIYSATGVFDALIYAEGEEVITLLCDYCRGALPLSQIPNVMYREGPRIQENAVRWIENLDTLPYPLYDSDAYPSMAGNQKIKIIVLDESRGCPSHCAFCIQPVKSGTRLRLKSPRRVVDEISKIMRSHGVRAFRYAGSTTPLRHAAAIAREILDAGVTITYSSFGHIQKASDAEFEVLRQSGCYAIFFGIESGSSEVLQKGFGKRIDPDLIRQTLISCRNAGIFTVGSMIFPGPFETAMTEKESIELLTAIKPDSVPIQFPGIYPGTAWREMPHRYNFEITARDYEREMMKYKIKLLYPPGFWAPLPYRLNNMSYKEFTRKTEEFARALEDRGILTHISDDQALMAFHAGYGGEERRFRDQLRLAFLTGDVALIGEITSHINRSVMRKN
ncbi:MAG: radical SAM protein [Chlamydiota bacterium]